jgi:3-(3-hydroxy-phenyl)propionate hydroxylase
MEKKTEVIIVGAGPTGVMLATLLGQKSIPVILVEKEKDVYPVTRATHLDVETLRNFQMTGLMDELKQFTESVTFFDMLDKKGKKLFEQSLTNQETIHYYKDDCFFDQVLFEHILRKGLARYSSVKLIVEAEATEIKSSEIDVTIVVKSKKNEEDIEVTGNWLIGCDGGSSFVRKTVFSKMNELKPPKDWILVDTILNKPEYATSLPDRFRYYLSNDRLSANAHGYGLNRRWEFEAKEGENMPEEAEIKSWVEKFISLDKITFLRIKKYTHLSLITPNWRINRIFLAGDAAHLMPPFAGQGLCSGVRDAINLAWKLTDVIQNKASNTLLDTYDTERQAQIKHTFRQTFLLKEILEADTDLQKWRRDVQIKSMGLLPTKIKAFMQKSFGNPKPLSVGCVDKSSKLSGQHLPQFQFPNNTLSDDKMGYNWTLIYATSAFHTADISLETYNIPLMSNSEIWEEWLRKNRIDFAIIRPDKIIFGTGKVQNWNTVYANYSKW